MPTPGILMRFASPQPSQSPSATSLSPKDLSLPPHCTIEGIYLLHQNDSQTPEYNTIYFLSDITPLLTTKATESNTTTTSPGAYFAKDQKTHSSSLKSLTWVVASYISGRDKSPASSSPTPQPPTSQNIPPLRTEIVINGSTPQPEFEHDYHAWYDEEHVHKLAQVPGWLMTRRYKFQTILQDDSAETGVTVDTASFYGVNFYAEENGLGGPEWKSSVTPWTLRIREQAAKGNVRRVWRIQEIVA